MVLPTIEPKATMEEAWAERDHKRAESNRKWEEARLLWQEGDRLRVEGNRIVVFTAQALYGKDMQIDWDKRTATPFGKEK